MRRKSFCGSWQTGFVVTGCKRSGAMVVGQNGQWWETSGGCNQFLDWTEAQSQLAFIVSTLHSDRASRLDCLILIGQS